MQTQRKNLLELDYSIGAINNLVSSLVDIEIEFGQLVDKMHDVKYKGQEMLYYDEHFRKIRIIQDLMRYTLNDLDRKNEEVDKIRNKLLKEVNKGERING